ncbi:MAG: SseB family protein [Eubacterium ramulus]
MANLMAVMRDARFLVPADFPPDVKKQVIEKAKRGEKVDTKIAPRMLPIIVQNQNGEHFAPAYTSTRTDENKCQISGNSECDH